MHSIDSNDGMKKIKPEMSNRWFRVDSTKGGRGVVVEVVQHKFVLKHLQFFCKNELKRKKKLIENVKKRGGVIRSFTRKLPLHVSRIIIYHPKEHFVRVSAFNWKLLPTFLVKDLMTPPSPPPRHRKCENSGKF